jgi:serine/threonine protein kinase
LRHPNIVQVYDLDLADGQPYIIMELLSGLSLSAYLKGLHQLGHSLPLETIGRLLDGLGSALDYAHAQGIVHRDVKPANDLRQEYTALPSILPLDCEPISWTLHRPYPRRDNPDADWHHPGDAGPMSPEQVRGEAVDARSDNYLGIMFTRC